MPDSSPSGFESPEEAQGELHYKAHHVTYRDEPDGLVLRIDDIPLAPLTRGNDGEYSTAFFPFRTFRTPQEVAQALIDREGTLWTLH